MSRSDREERAAPVAHRRRWLAAAALLLATAVSPAQEKPGKDDDEVQKLGPVDPYTGGDAALMAAAGIVAYGSFPWADNHRTDDIDRVLGEGRVLWVETTHFRIGFNLKSAPWPEEAAAKRALQEEIKALRKKLPKVAEKPKRLDPWLRLHLTAQRCEKAYADFQQLVGATDAEFDAPGKGKYLGLPDKYLLLLFQKKSDVARYMDRFCNRKDEGSARHYHEKTRQMLLAVPAEALEGFDESGVHGHVVYSIWHNLMNGFLGYGFPLPHWFAEGIAHWYGRKVETVFLNIPIRDDEAVASEKQENWPLKVRRRAQHDSLWFPFEKMVAWEKWDELGYHAHSQSWSRVDFLVQLDREKVGLMLRKLKEVPADGTFDGQAPQIRTAAVKLLFDLFGLDAATFDQKWREWVLKTYPKK